MFLWKNEMQSKLNHGFGPDINSPVCTPGLNQVIATKGGQSPGTNWRRPPGRPRKTWTQQIGKGTTASWRQMRQSAKDRGHRVESSQRTSAAYTRHDDDDFLQITHAPTVTSRV